MKAITEDILRYELRNSQPEVYIIPEGKILTPAAREYLQMRKIRFEKEGGNKLLYWELRKKFLKVMHLKINDKIKK